MVEQALKMINGPNPTLSGFNATADNLTQTLDYAAITSGCIEERHLVTDHLCSYMGSAPPRIPLPRFRKGTSGATTQHARNFVLLTPTRFHGAYETIQHDVHRNQPPAKPCDDGEGRECAL